MRQKIGAALGVECLRYQLLALVASEGFFFNVEQVAHGGNSSIRHIGNRFHYLLHLVAAVVRQHRGPISRGATLNHALHNGADHRLGIDGFRGYVPKQGWQVLR